MRRRLRWFAALTGIVLVASGCNSGGGSSGGEILIGVTLDRSGDNGILGAAEANALNLTVNNLNRDGGVLGKQIRLVMKDNKSKPEESARLVTELIDSDKVVGIVGAGTTATTAPFLDITEQKKKPVVTMGAADTLLTPFEKRKFVFKSTPNAPEIVSVMLDDIVAQGFKRIGLLAPANQFGDTGVRSVTGAAAQAGITVSGAQRYSDADKDYTEQITKLVDGNPQAILVSAIMPAAGIAAKNIKEAGYGGRVYFDGGAGADLFVKGATTYAEDMYMVHSSILAANQMTATTPGQLAQKEFFIEYTQKYGTFSGYASYAADALSLLVEGIKEAKSTDGQKIRDAMEGLSYDGLTGSFKFSPTNHGGPSAESLTVLTVRKGGWVLSQ